MQWVCANVLCLCQLLQVAIDRWRTRRSARVLLFVARVSAGARAAPRASKSARARQTSHRRSCWTSDLLALSFSVLSSSRLVSPRLASSAFPTSRLLGSTRQRSLSTAPLRPPGSRPSSLVPTRPLVSPPPPPPPRQSNSSRRAPQVSPLVHTNDALHSPLGGRHLGRHGVRLDVGLPQLALPGRVRLARRPRRRRQGHPRQRRRRSPLRLPFGTSGAQGGRKSRDPAAVFSRVD